MGAVIEIIPPAHGPSRDNFPPMADPVLVSDQGNAWLPHPFYHGMKMLVPLCEGLAVAWAPCTPAPQLLLSIWGGHPGCPTDESVTTTLTRTGLRRLIADLQSIDRQMDDLHG